MNRTRTSLVLLGSLVFNCILAGEVSVNEWLDSGPLPVNAPGFIRGPNIQSEAFGPRFVLSNTYLDLAALQPSDGEAFLWKNGEGQNWKLKSIPEGEFLEIKPIRKTEYQIAYHAFYIESGGLNKYEMEVESPQMFEVFLQGNKLASSYKPAGDSIINTGKATLDLDRGKFLVLVKSLYTRGEENKWQIRAKLTGKPVLGTRPQCGMNIHHLLEGTKLGSVSISARRIPGYGQLQQGGQKVWKNQQLDRDQGCFLRPDPPEFQESRNKGLSLDARGKETLLYQTRGKRIIGVDI